MRGRPLHLVHLLTSSHRSAVSGLLHMEWRRTKQPQWRAAPRSPAFLMPLVQEVHRNLFLPPLLVRVDTQAVNEQSHINVVPAAARTLASAHTGHVRLLDTWSQHSEPTHRQARRGVMMTAD